MTNLINRRKKVYKKDLLFYGFIIIYAGFLLFLSYKLNIWEDESYSLYTTSNNLATIISQSYNFEGQPPGYFILLALWRQIDSGIFFARLFSLLFLGLSALFFYRIVRLISGIEYSRWMLIIFILNPFTVWAGLEIRLYSMVIFLSTTLIYYFFRFYIGGKNNYLYLFLFISLIGLYTQYFFLLEIVALAFSLLIFKGWKIFFKLFLYLTPVIVLFSPNLLFIHSEVNMAQSHIIEHSMLNRISNVLHSPQTLMLGLEMVPFNIGINRGIRVSFILLSMYAYFRIYKKQQIKINQCFRRINFIFLALAVLILLNCVLFVITSIGYQARYMSIAFPMYIIVFTLFKIYNHITRNLIYVIISMYYISLLFLIYKRPVKFYDYKSVAQFLNKIEYSKEPVLLYSKILLPAFTFYYAGSNHLFSLPALKFDSNYYENNLKDTSEFKKAIQIIDSPTKSYILITGRIEGSKYPINMNQKMIDECLKVNYNITLDTLFQGNNQNYILRIRRLEIKRS